MDSATKERLIQIAARNKARSLEKYESSAQTDGAGASLSLLSAAKISEDWIRWDRHPGYRKVAMLLEGAAALGITNPFFVEHQGLADATTLIDGKERLNFSSYNYLGLCGHPEVSAAAIDAIQKYGTSVSASRIVSGERPLHRELEAELADFYESEDALVFVSGHATAVTTIGCLFGSKDLILHDELIHNCAVEGAKLSGAKRLSFPHNDWTALDQILTRCRRDYERVLIVIEGLYSMDGDVPDLNEFVRVKKLHHALLMVDEAHSLGVIGENGFGLREHCSVESSDVDLWMGTLSKALAGCGGYIAGTKALIQYLKHAAPGFIYSVGMSPPLCAAALAALRILRREPYRIHRLQQRGRLFLELAQCKGLPTGFSEGFSIIPIITANSIRAALLSRALLDLGIAVQPILYPAVPENSARLRFFISSSHTTEDIHQAVTTLAEQWENF